MVLESNFQKNTLIISLKLKAKWRKWKRKKKRNTARRVLFKKKKEKKRKSRIEKKSNCA